MKVDFKKGNGLVPAIIQDSKTGKVLMLGYMNEKALKKTHKSGKVTFYSRSKDRLWTKGETSKNYLFVEEILNDCDNDTLLIKARPAGPTCHTGADTCFDEKNKANSDFLHQLESIIHDRQNNPLEKSYTTKLFNKGVAKIAQKVGEEATEALIDGVLGNKNELKEETADLLYHLLVLLRSQDVDLDDVLAVLKKRHKPD
jgi:phosphoribosyl-ATP pyrophosphohydrolase/phosphoribosyl-AMP cyclohydrolase